MTGTYHLPGELSHKPKTKRTQKLAREAKILRQKLLREKRLSEGLGALEMKTKRKRKPQSNHGVEPVTPEVLKLLGRSFKVSRKRNALQDSQEKRNQAEKMRKSHMEQEKAGTKWRAGMREQLHENRMGKARQERKREGRTEKPEKSRSARLSESSNLQSAKFSESDQNSVRKPKFQQIY